MSYADHQAREIQRAADRAEDRSFDEIISEVEGAACVTPLTLSLTAVLRFAFDRSKPNNKDLIREQLLDAGL